MSNCGCCIKLNNGVSDVYAFGYDTKDKVVVACSGIDNFEICDHSCKTKRHDIWLVSKDNPRIVDGLEKKFLKTLASFGKTGRLLKGK